MNNNEFDGELSSKYAIILPQQSCQTFFCLNVIQYKSALKTKMIKKTAKNTGFSIQ